MASSSPSLYTKTFPNATVFPTFFSASSHPSKYNPLPTNHLSRSFTLSPATPIARLGRCHVSTPGPPSPPPPPESEPQPPASSSSGFATTISRIQDTTQIFLAVLFWMSLFFWASAWDGRNDDKPNKGSRFRR